jgi:hypothetical protein
MKTTRIFALATLLAAATQAATINETEIDGAAINNSTANAQVIANGSFTAPQANALVPSTGVVGSVTIQGRMGDTDVDFFRFTTTLPNLILFLDVDIHPGTFDSIIAVFDANGTLIAYGDDYTTDPGSESSSDAAIAPFLLASPGTYYIAISEFPNYPQAALLATEVNLGIVGKSVTGATAGLSAFDLDGPQPLTSNAYNLHATLATPEPGTMLLAALGLAVLGWRKRA